MDRLAFPGARMLVFTAGTALLGAAIWIGWWSAGEASLTRNFAAQSDPWPKPSEAFGKADRLAVAVVPGRQAALAAVVPEPPSREISAPQTMPVERETELLPSVTPIANPPLPRPAPFARSASDGASAAASAKPPSRLAEYGKNVLTVEDISRLKALLNLTPAQERHWPAVETELRQLATQWKQKARTGKGGQISVDRALLKENESEAVQRLAFAAAPLIMSLNEDQKRHARQLARSVGLEAVASAF